MNKVTILLDSYTKIKEFLATTTTFMSDLDLVKGRYVVDAKSAIGIFTLDLSKPIDVVIHTVDEDEVVKFQEVMKKFTA